MPEGFFFRSEAAIVSGEAAIVIVTREEKKPSGCGSYKSHFHAYLKPNTLPNRFLWDLFVFDKSACGATMCEMVQINTR